jgi:hypothetical protein
LIPSRRSVAALLLAGSLFSVPRSAVGQRAAQEPRLTSLSDADLSTLTIRLERTGCFGNCPAYTLTIHGDGRIEYSGKSYVKETGGHQGSMESEAIRSLVSDFAKARYWQLEEDYSGAKCNGFCFDMASATTQLDINGMTHRVRHYYGCGGVPRALFDLESAIDKAANSERWTGDVSKTGPMGTTCVGAKPGRP